MDSTIPLLRVIAHELTKFGVGMCDSLLAEGQGGVKILVNPSLPLRSGSRTPPRGGNSSD